MEKFVDRFLSGLVGFILGCMFLGLFFYLKYKDRCNKSDIVIVKREAVPDVKFIIDTIRLTKTKKEPIYITRTDIKIKIDTFTKDSIVYVTRDSIRNDTILIDYPVSQYTDTLEHKEYSLIYCIEGKELTNFSYRLGVKPVGIEGYTKVKPYYISGKLGLNTIGGEFGYKDFGLGVFYNTQAKLIPFVSFKKQFHF